MQCIKLLMYCNLLFLEEPLVFGKQEPLALVFRREKFGGKMLNSLYVETEINQKGLI